MGYAIAWKMGFMFCLFAVIPNLPITYVDLYEMYDFWLLDKATDEEFD